MKAPNAFAKIRSFGIDATALIVNMVTILPKEVPNNNADPTIAGQKFFKKLPSACIFLAFLGSPNHSKSLNTILPKNIACKN